MWESIRKQYPFFTQHPDLIYFDNAATALKPQCVIASLMQYYNAESVNVHRSGYRLAKQVDEQYETARSQVALFLGVERENVIFTFGTTDGMNRLANGLRHQFQAGDVILTTMAEHASCILPWMKVAKETGANIVFIPLENGRVNIETVQSLLNNQVKAVVLAEVGNVLGYRIDLEKIANCCHAHDILLIVDGAQSVAHGISTLQNVDAFVFSAHKLGATTGCGAMYLSQKIQSLMEVSVVGGTSNCDFDETGHYELCSGYRGYEAGTPAIEGSIALGQICAFYMEIGMNKICQREKALHAYLLEKLSAFPHVEIYNADADVSMITFNIKGIHPQDAAAYFDAHGICLRSGQHCARLLKQVIHVPATLRISLSFYNTFEEIDRFLTVCQGITLEACLSLYI